MICVKKFELLWMIIIIEEITRLQIIQMGVSNVIFVTKRMLIQEP
jgi:hypothetical protein